jgi:hypothetical protein
VWQGKGLGQIDLFRPSRETFGQAVIDSERARPARVAAAIARATRMQTMAEQAGRSTPQLRQGRAEASGLRNSAASRASSMRPDTPAPRTTDCQPIQSRLLRLRQPLKPPVRQRARQAHARAGRSPRAARPAPVECRLRAGSGQKASSSPLESPQPVGSKRRLPMPTLGQRLREQGEQPVAALPLMRHRRHQQQAGLARRGRVVQAASQPPGAW